MTRKVYYFLQVPLLIFCLWSSSVAYASTGRGIPGIIQPVSQVVDTVQTVAGLIGVVLIVSAALVMARNEGAGLITLCFAILALAIAVNADTIVQSIRPGAGQAATFDPYTFNKSAALLDELVTLGVHVWGYVLLWIGVRHAQRARRI